MSNYLFVHQNFPGQFPHVTKALAERGHTVVAIGEAKLVKNRVKPHPAIHVVGYATPKGAGKETHHYLKDLEAHTRRGQAVFRVAQTLSAKGFKPDVIVVHPGWGESLFLRDVFPHARIMQYLEFYYRAKGADVGFDPEFPSNLDGDCKTRVKNSTQLLSFDQADVGISPTLWQKSRYPDSWQPRIAQLHDGIDTSRALPNELAAVEVDFGDKRIQLTRKHEVLTYVARNLEPYRGFHCLMRAIPAILEQRPNAHIVIVGSDNVSYGRRLPDEATYRDKYLAEWDSSVDRRRVHFLGRLPYSHYLRVLQISSLHVYWTYPFVLSWSMLEAMSAGCLVLGSATAPVQEVIEHGSNGFLTPFFDRDKMIKSVCELLSTRHDHGKLRQAARETILQRFDLHSLCLPQQIAFLQK